MPIELLSPDDDIAREDYERAFHAAFQRVPENRLVRSLWLWDEAAGRVATRVPYADQLVYLLRDAAGSIGAAIGVNVRMVQFQSAAYGFSPPETTRGTCEFLTFFAANDRQLATKWRLMRACFADLRRRGFTTGYTTVGPRLYRFYSRVGAALHAEAEIRGEHRYFMSFDLAFELRSATAREAA